MEHQEQRGVDESVNKGNMEGHLVASVAIKCGHQSQSQSFAFSLSFLPISACPKAKVEGPLWVAGYYSSRFDSSHYGAAKTFDGRDSGNHPSLEILFEFIVPIDSGFFDRLVSVIFFSISTST